MSYGMHDYLAEKAMQNRGMRKVAAKDDVSKKMIAQAAPGRPADERARWGEQVLNAAVNAPVESVFNNGGKTRGYDLGLLRGDIKRIYSRSRTFVAEHPEILYGLGAAAAGAGIGALVSPKRRLLGSLIGLGLGGAVGAGGKMAWDKYKVGDKLTQASRAVGSKLNMAGQDLRQKYNKLRYGEELQGMTPAEHEEHIKSLAAAGLRQR